MRESYVKRKVIEHAKWRGFMQRKVRYEGRRNAPDSWFFGPKGRLIIIEFKQLGKPAREGQAREIERLRNLGFEVHIIDNIADGMMVFP